MVGWPAIGSSLPGVKIRTRTSVPSLSRGKTKVHSENDISTVMACITSVDGTSSARTRSSGSLRLRTSGNTASWLPPKTWSVKTSRCRYG